MSKRMSLEEPHALPSESTRRFNITDLTQLQVRVTELCHASERKRWQYALEVRYGGRKWQIYKRYSEIREFWESLSSLLVQNQGSCTERCHFLAGCENHKFPKKRLLHTRGVLEERANALEEFFKSLTMRLNLCNPRSLALCHFEGCTTLALFTSFFEIQAQYKNMGAPNPYNTMYNMRAYKSMPLVKNRSKDGRQTYHGSLSLATLQEVHIA